MPGDLTVSTDYRSDFGERLVAILEDGQDGATNLRRGEAVYVISRDQPFNAARGTLVATSDLVPVPQDIGASYVGRASDSSWLWREPFSSFLYRGFHAQRGERQRFLFNFPNADDESTYSVLFLAQQIMPLIGAMATMQRVLYGSELRIHSIEHNSPFTLDTSGAPGLYKNVSEDVIRWKRKHAQALAALAEAEKLAEVERMKAEVGLAEAQSERERAEAAAATERARQARAEASRIEVALQRERFDLAVHMIKTIEPDLPPPVLHERIAQILPAIKALTGPPDVIPVANTGEVSSTQLGFNEEPPA